MGKAFAKHAHPTALTNTLAVAFETGCSIHMTAKSAETGNRGTLSFMQGAHNRL